MDFSVRPDFFLNFRWEFQSSLILSILNFWLCPFAWDLQLYISLAWMEKIGQKQTLEGFLYAILISECNHVLKYCITKQYWWTRIVLVLLLFWKWLIVLSTKKINYKKGLCQCAKLQDLGGRHYYYWDCSGGKQSPILLCRLRTTYL